LDKRTHQDYYVYQKRINKVKHVVTESLSATGFQLKAEISASAKNFWVRQLRLSFNLNCTTPQLHHQNTIPKLRNFNLDPTTAQVHHRNTIRTGKLLNFTSTYHNTGEATEYFQPRLPTPQYNYIAQAMAAVLPTNSGPPPQPNATYVSLHPDTYLPPFLSPLTNP
jgi:hypothetical protein